MRYVDEGAEMRSTWSRGGLLLRRLATKLEVKRVESGAETTDRSGSGDGDGVSLVLKYAVLLLAVRVKGVPCERAWKPIPTSIIIFVQIGFMACPKHPALATSTTGLGKLHLAILAPRIAHVP